MCSPVPLYFLANVLEEEVMVLCLEIQTVETEVFQRFSTMLSVSGLWQWRLISDLLKQNRAIYGASALLSEGNLKQHVS